jgi:hypothetical protein
MKFALNGIALCNQSMNVKLKKSHFAKMQETTRRDVKQCLIWSVVIKMGYHKNLCNQWDLATIPNIVLGSVIMHNMIIEDELRTPIWKSWM